jgi:hypothetical protein
LGNLRASCAIAAEAKMNVAGCESKLQRFSHCFLRRFLFTPRRVELFWFTDMPTARRKNFRSVAVILFECG